MSDEPLDRINTLSIPGGGAGTDLEGRPPVPTAASDEVFEGVYQQIGWWKGPCSKPEARAQMREFWRLEGDRGLRWLAGRLRREGHIDLLQGVASLLADAGSAAIPPILDELEHDRPIDQAMFLLKALGWMGRRESKPSRRRPRGSKRSSRHSSTTTMPTFASRQSVRLGSCPGSGPSGYSGARSRRSGMPTSDRRSRRSAAPARQAGAEIPTDYFARFGLIIIPATDPDLGPWLSERHREAKGITDAISLRLAAALLEEKRFKLDRIRRQDVEKAAKP
jgi:hypothetical protein